jgi:transcriptional regulator with XRE-family HTH domain
MCVSARNINYTQKNIKIDTQYLLTQRKLNNLKGCVLATFTLLIKNMRTMSFDERLKRIRIEKGLSKGDLANLIGVHYSQIGRYENKGAQPSADILSKLANALGITTDFLMNGTSENLADNSLSDKELLNQFKFIEKLPEVDKNVVKILLDAFITKKQIQKLII